MALHKNSLVGDRHAIHNWEYADSVERLAATGFVASDVNKLSLQLDDNTFWVLTNHSPTTWLAMGGGGGSSVWGGITGTLANQTDLQTVLNNKVNLEGIRTAGVVVIPSYTDNGNGTITVGAGQYSLYPNKTFLGTPLTYTIPGGTFNLVDNSTNYLLANYNGGTPNLTLIQAVPAIIDLDSDSVPIFSMYRSGNDIHVFDWDNLALGLAEKLNRRFRRTDRFHIDNGLGLSELATRIINIDSGAMWVGANLITLNAVSSSSPESHFYSHVASVWTRSNISQYNNSQYDNGTNLVTLSNNRYAVNWIYRSAQAAGALYTILGRGDYTLLEAQNSAEPPKPDEISTQAVLVGRIIVLKGASTATQIDRVIDTTFGFSGAVSHNDLSGIQGGTTDEHYHLTNAEYGKIAQIDGKTSMTGFPEDSAGNYLCNLAYNETTRTVTVTPTASSFDVFIAGIKYTFTGAQSAQHTTAQGAHFVYINEIGVITVSTTAWDLLKHAPIAYIFWDSTNSHGICFEERHHAGRDLYWHRNQHVNEGTKASSGFAITGYTLNDGSTDAAVTWSMPTGRVEDEDIRIDTQAVLDNGPYNILKRVGAGGAWQLSRTNTLPYLFSGSNLRFNQNVGGTWQDTNVTEDFFVNVYVAALTALPSTSYTPASSNQIVIVPGQTQYSTEAAAHGESLSQLALDGLPIMEWVALYQITLRYNATNPSAYTNTTRTAISRVLRIVGNSAVIQAAAATDHGSLVGLSDNDHPQYVLGDAPVTALGTLATPNATIALTQQSRTYTATTGGNVTITFTGTPAAGFDRDIQLQLTVTGTDVVTITNDLTDGGVALTYSGGGKKDLLEIKFVGSTLTVLNSAKDVK